MTKGLLVSRLTKINLHHEALTKPNDTNLSKYKTYRNLYNKIIRASRKHYFATNLNKAKKDPKKLGNSLGKQ